MSDKAHHAVTPLESTRQKGMLHRRIRCQIALLLGIVWAVLRSPHLMVIVIGFVAGTDYAFVYFVSAFFWDAFREVKNVL